MKFFCPPNDRYDEGYHDGYIMALKEALFRIGIFHPGLADSSVAQDIQKMLDSTVRDIK